LRKEHTLLNQLKEILTILIPAIISIVGFIIVTINQAGILG